MLNIIIICWKIIFLTPVYIYVKCSDPLKELAFILDRPEPETKSSLVLV